MGVAHSTPRMAVTSNQGVTPPISTLHKVGDTPPVGKDGEIGVAPPLTATRGNNSSIVANTPAPRGEIALAPREEKGLRRTTRERRAPAWLHDYETNFPSLSVC